MGRHRYADTAWVPGPQIESVQSMLALDPEVGFLWKADVRPEQGIEIGWRDAEPYLLSTDSRGFLNPPEGIARRAAGETPDVIGLGDSFFQMASNVFRERFEREGLFYYSLAMHRQGPPQYNRNLTGDASASGPRWVLYGITENDFGDTLDFERWQESGLDWFAFHSGTWCGPPSSGSPGLDRLRSALPGTWAMWRALRARYWPGPVERSSPQEVHRYLLEARDVAEARGARFLLVLVPEKKTILGRPGDDAERHQRLAELAVDSGIRVVDLRAAFASAPDPASLFFRLDAHWNEAGEALAAERILEAIRDDRRSAERS